VFGQNNIVSDKLLFDVNQINVSMLYHDEEDKQKVTSLPELEREMILSKHIDQIKEIAEMNIAFAATRCHSKLAESEVSDDNSHSSKRSRRSSNIQVDSMEILIGQTIVNDYGEVGRVVVIDPNGRPVLEVDDSDNSVVEVAEKNIYKCRCNGIIGCGKLRKYKLRSRDMQCCNH
jgi:hypothetical protein